MRRFRRASAAVSVAVVLGLAPGCTSQANESTGDTLRVVGPFEIHSLEPTATSCFFTRLQVTETLVTADLDGELAPRAGLGVVVVEGRPDLDVRAGAGRDVPRRHAADAGVRQCTRSTSCAADEASPLADAPIEAITATE